MKKSKNRVLDKIERAKMTMVDMEITEKDIENLTEKEYKEDIEKRIVKRKIETDVIFDMVCKGIPTENIGRKLNVAESYVLDMIRRGKEGAVLYWRMVYGM